MGKLEIPSKRKLPSWATKERIEMAKRFWPTGVLFDINGEHHEIIFKNPPKIKNNPQHISFSGFSFTKNQIFELIKKNENWHNIERDIVIYQERQKGRYLHEIAENVDIKDKAISVVIKKVSGAVNYYKGKLFEDFISKKLKDSGLFKKVEKLAGKGESDILAYTKDEKEFYIYSLKNIKINHIPFWLSKEKLRPELERALLQSLDYKVHLILLVFDNFNNKIKQFKIDFNKPENVDISK